MSQGDRIDLLFVSEYILTVFTVQKHGVIERTSVRHPKLVFFKKTALELVALYVIISKQMLTTTFFPFTAGMHFLLHIKLTLENSTKVFFYFYL